MVTTITPVVHGRRSSYRAAIAWHAVGAALSAGVFGALLGAAGAALDAPWNRAGMVLVVAAALLYAARELALIPVPLLHLRRQVPEWWRTFYGPRTAAFLYGLGLGVGWLTHFSYGTFTVVSVLALATGHPLLSAVVCANFGVARAVATALANWPRANDDEGSPIARLERLAASRLPAIANLAALACIAGAGSFVLLK